MKKILVSFMIFAAQGAFALDLPSDILVKVFMRSVLSENTLSQSEKDATLLARKNRVLLAALEGLEAVPEFTAYANDLNCDSGLHDNQHCLISIQTTNSTIAFDVYVRSGKVVSADMKAVAGSGI